LKLFKVIRKDKLKSPCKNILVCRNCICNEAQRICLKVQK